MSTFSEGRRQTVHISMLGFALLLRWLTWWQGALMATAALAFNLWLLPRLCDRALFRPNELGHGVSAGIVFYPLSVLLLILALSNRLDLAAGAWAVMAAGDGMATLAGRWIGGRRWPWNPHKTMAGSLALALCGGAAGSALLWWMQPAVAKPPPLAFVLCAPLAAAIVASLVESLPIRLDDNLSVPATAGAMLWLLSLVTAEAWSANAAIVAGRLAPALAVNAAMAAAAHRAGTVRFSGAVVGALIGMTLYAGLGFGGWLVLLAAFLTAALTSRVGLERKSVLGIGEDRGGRRGAGNAIANCGAAAVAAVASITTPYGELATLAAVTALTAGASDTAASEIGKAWGRRTLLVTTLRPVPPGTPGAISLEGTAAGVIAAFLLALCGVGVGLVPLSAVGIVVVASTLGAFLESALGSTFEHAGIVNNDVLNFLNTAVAVLAALLLWRWVP